MDVHFRKLQSEETAAYRKIRLECLKKYPQHFTTDYHDENQKKELFFETCIKRDDRDNFVIGAFVDNNLIGISGFKRHERTKVNHSGVIIQVYVKPFYQGQHIGSGLVKETLNMAFNLPGIEQIEIGVISINQNAEKIYKKLGFETFGIHNKFLKINNLYYDHIMMMLDKNQYHFNS